MLDVVSAAPQAGAVRHAKIDSVWAGRRRDRAEALLIGGAYTSLAAALSLATPAWESNDEYDHFLYVQRVAGGSLPRISAANGHESHQPPLYYLLAAAWERMLGISPNQAPALTNGKGASPTSLAYYHNYDSAQHLAAVRVHEVRFLSVIFGLITVLACLGLGRRLGLSRALTASTALAIAVWPKFLVVTATITNDCAVIAACAVLLYCAVRWWNDRRLVWSGAVGLAGAAAVLSKYNAVPVVAVVFAFLALEAFRAQRYRHVVTASAVAMAAVSWWFVRNLALYGSLSARKQADSYLNETLPGLIVPTGFTDVHRFLRVVPDSLRVSLWYDGDFNQFHIPIVLGVMVSSSAAVCAIAVIVHALRRRDGILVLALLTVAAGLLAVLIIAKDTTQAEGRVAFVALVPMAFVLVRGATLVFAGSSLATRRAAVALLVWPAMLSALDLYVAIRWVIPYATL